MGHKIGKPECPGAGSQGFIPHVRARKACPRVKTWPQSKEVKLLGFVGYKAGMSHVTFIDNSKTTPTKGTIISVPVTIIETPKVKIHSLKIYSLNKRRQKVCSCQVVSDKEAKELNKKIVLPKKPKTVEEQLKKADEFINDIINVTVVGYSLPNGAAGGKKKPDMFEIAIGGSPKEQFEYAKKLLGSELSVKDVIKPGDQIDAISVSKGKGFQGVIQRYGVKLQIRNKSDRSERMIGSIGADKPRKVLWTIGMPGQMGFHNRSELNKWVIKVSDNGAEVTPVGGFNGYGILRHGYIMIKGSVPGAAKRLIRLRLSMRAKNNIPKSAPELTWISKVK